MSPGQGNAAAGRGPARRSRSDGPLGRAGPGASDAGDLELERLGTESPGPSFPPRPECRQAERAPQSGPKSRDFALLAPSFGGVLAHHVDPCTYARAYQ